MIDISAGLRYLAANSMDAILICLVIAFIVILLKIQTTKDNFDLRAVISGDNGQPSIHKIGQLVALLLSTWMLIYLAINHQMTEGYFGTYMGVWAAAQAADKWLGRDQRPEPPPDSNPQTPNQ
jgi:hypothetical protein